MSPFVIFAIALTVVYVIYYAYFITKDLYGIKMQHKSDTESIDVSGMVQEEEPTVINEHPDNEVPEDAAYTEQVSEDGLHIYEPETKGQSEEATDEEHEETLTSDKLNETRGEDLEDIDSDSFKLDSKEFDDFLNQKHINNKRNIKNTNVIDNL